MAKTPPQRRKKQQQTRETNWLVIGGLIVVSLVVFGGLLFLALRPGESQTVQTLAEFCESNPQNCAAIGNEDAPVTMVEVSDFGCSHCTAFHNNTADDLKAEFVDSGTLRWVALPYALSATTVPAAGAALCAGEQDNYFGFANALFAIESLDVRLTAAGFEQAAESIGLDMDAFRSCMDDGRNLDLVNTNRDMARTNRVSGTPTFFLNGEKLVGAQPQERFEAVIDRLLAKKPAAKAKKK